MDFAKEQAMTPGCGKQSFLRRIDSVISSVNKIQAIISACAIFLIMFLVSADVISRFLFGKPVMGTYEIGEMLMVCIVFLAVGYTQMVGGHVKVETLTRRLNADIRTGLSTIMSFLGFVIFALMTYSSWNLALAALRNKRTIQGLLGLPLFPSKLLVTIGAATLAICFFIETIKEVGNITWKRQGS